MKKIIFHPEAEEEMLLSARYYESQAKGLGPKFLDEINTSLKKISRSPQTWPVISGKIRRYLIRRFPFGLLYEVYPDRIYILAVMHLQRKPNYWTNRTKRR